MSVANVETSRVVLIGVGSYDDSNLADLRSVTAGVAALQRAFSDPSVWGLPAANCVATDPDAGSREVLGMIRRAAAEAHDVLLIYFAGHGLRDPHDLELHLALKHTVPGEPESSLRYEYLRREVLKSQARHKVVILDCCYSGSALGGVLDTAGQIANHTPIDGAYLLTSCAETRLALAPIGETYTAFTAELLHALNNGVSDIHDDVLSMDAIYNHLHQVLRSKARPIPQQRSRNAGGHFPIVRNKAHVAATAPVLTLTPQVRHPEIAASPHIEPKKAAKISARHAELSANWRPKVTNSGDTNAMLGLGVLLHARGDLVSAEVWYQRAIENGSVHAMVGLGVLLEQREDLTGAETWYRRAIQDGDTFAMIGLGVLFEQRNEYAEAESWYLRSAEGGNTLGMRKLAFFFEERDQPAKAKAWYQRAKKRLPQTKLLAEEIL